MPAYIVYFWKKAPFIRLLIPMMAGIMLQWHLQLTPAIWWFTLPASLLVLVSFFFIPFFNRFRLAVLSGIAGSILFLSLGALLTWHKDIRHQKTWLGNSYTQAHPLLVTLDEPLVEKSRSFKANASARFLLIEEKLIPVKGRIILYFQKDKISPSLGFGSQIIIKKPLQLIRSAGNPGGFDYQRYSLFHGITHQVYLTANEYILLDQKNEPWLSRFINTSRERILTILRSAIKSEKELGLAEALLIGYKDDLDKTLVQSYTNTGVVHIIAISGLHLGLIYWVLILLFKPLKKKAAWLRPVLIITVLWLFTLLAGAQPSVLRSALMFTCIILGENLTKKTSIYNTLALSAFLLLCHNPYWLWDLGFQLSYAAVLSIIIFMQPVYNWIYIPNKFLDLIWKLNAVTIAAQLLTLPLCIYHFHQFPNYFLLSNLVAVPLSSVILLCEILLCMVSIIPGAASLLGILISWLIRLMNTWVVKIEALPFSLWEGLEISTAQAILLFVVIGGVSYGLLERSKTGFKFGFVALLVFVTLRSYSFIQTGQQKKIIVYNIPRQSAVEFIDGNKYVFKGDAGIPENFHLKPSRIRNRISATEALNHLCFFKNYISYRGKHVLLIAESFALRPTMHKQVIDLLVISKAPKIDLSRLASSLEIRQVVFDGSVPSWKLKAWKPDCDSLHIPYHVVTEKGAFVMNLD